MAKFDILEDLKWRGAINQETDEEGLRKYLAEHDDLALYCGTDPTGDSLHIGHLIPFMILKRFQMAGYHPVILIGGALVLLVIRLVERLNVFFKLLSKLNTMKRN